MGVGALVNLNLWLGLRLGFPDRVAGYWAMCI